MSWKNILGARDASSRAPVSPLPAATAAAPVAAPAAVAAAAHAPAATSAAVTPARAAGDGRGRFLGSFSE